MGTGQYLNEEEKSRAKRIRAAMEKVILYVPSTLLDGGVEIIDIPGWYHPSFACPVLLYNVAFMIAIFEGLDLLFERCS